ncbi:hypothetical protein OH799_00420 [Nocardia sp. NBC_00881]|uniref:hypothetical protein n=1 Tax=Nocardia sp. NBC_00881 TaxID=2975995 RepID=UPI00387005A0|nr:hypothetical protein OH799_00420 [Nocardia sp. NBC_00881]
MTGEDSRDAEDIADGTPDIAFTLAELGGPAEAGDIAVHNGVPGSLAVGDVAGAESESPSDAGAAAIVGRAEFDGPGASGDIAVSDGVPGSSAAGGAESEAPSDDGAADIIQRVADELRSVAPVGWQRLTAEFAITVTAGSARAVCATDDAEVEVDVPNRVLEVVREHRGVAADSSTGPWWRLLLQLTAEGRADVEYDYGDDPFPDEQLLAPEAYRADLAAYPRARLPVWLAAYIGHGGRQTRSPQQAAAAARADRDAAVWSTLAENEFPPYPVMWARWTTIAAAFVAAGSEWGPRMLPSLAGFESSRRSGATICALAGGRAVLSGGVWNAPALDDTYNGDAEMPNFFAGAPDWVADPVLNPRAGVGLMSFCYWWDAGRWYRGESPSAEQCAPAIPGVWSADTVVDIVARLISRRPGAAQRSAAATLLSAAEVGVVTPETVAKTFGDNDADGALYQFRMAGLVADTPQPMPQQLAIARVRQYILGRGLDTTGYPLDELVADRLSCGWMVFAPVPGGEIAIGRAIFYVADDGVLEPSSSSVPPTRFVSGFQERFRRRQQPTG